LETGCSTVELMEGDDCSATVAPIASGASTTVCGMELSASIESAGSELRSQKIDVAATPAAMLAPRTGRAKRIQRSLTESLVRWAVTTEGRAATSIAAPSP
jgi:hypothetical protein